MLVTIFSGGNNVEVLQGTLEAAFTRIQSIRAVSTVGMSYQV
jgi:hypothetical protein